MNRFILSICICTLFSLFISCKKDNSQLTKVSKSIKGSWELRQTSGGMLAGSNIYAPGNGNILKFTDSDYEKYADGQFVTKGPYILLGDTSVEESVCLVIPAGEYTNRIVYDGNFDYAKQFMQLSDNKLTFLSGCYAYDAGQYSEYERVNDER